MAAKTVPMVDKPREPLFARRARVQRQLADQREELATEWRALERGAYAQEQRIAGIARGFRAVLPVGALAGTLWLVRRFGPRRLIGPLTLGAGALGFVSRVLPALAMLRRVAPFLGRVLPHHRNDKDHNGTHAAAGWLTLVLPLVSAYLKRTGRAHQRRADIARARTPAYRGGGRHGGLRRPS